MDGNEVIIQKNGKEVARLISKERKASFLTDSLVGILHGEADEKALRMERALQHEGLD